MRRFWASLVLALALAACGQADQAQSPAGGETVYGGMADMAQNRAVATEEAEAPAAAPAPPPMDSDSTGTRAPGGPSQPSGPTPVLYLAYTYALGLEIPSERLTGVMDRHVQACQTAGPRLCQLVNSNRTGDPQSYIEGFVSLRGEPGWLNRFKAGLAQEADEAGGGVLREVGGGVGGCRHGHPFTRKRRHADKTIQLRRSRPRLSRSHRFFAAPLRPAADEVMKVAPLA